MSDHDRWLGLCVAAADEASRAGEFPNGACVVVGQDVIAVAGSETEGGADPTAHAEVTALRRAAASRRLTPEAVLYTTLEPCAMCLHSAAAVGVARIVFACSRSEVGDAAYLSNLDASAMAAQLRQPLTLIHHGDRDGRVAKLVTDFLADERDQQSDG